MVATHPRPLKCRRMRYGFDCDVRRTDDRDLGAVAHVARMPEERGEGFEEFKGFKEFELLGRRWSKFFKTEETG